MVESVPSPVPAGTEREALDRIGALADEFDATSARTYDERKTVDGAAWHYSQGVAAIYHEAARRIRLVAAVVSSSPATPARHPGDEGNPAIDALKASSARIATAPPASPAETREGPLPTTPGSVIYWLGAFAHLRDDGRWVDDNGDSTKPEDIIRYAETAELYVVWDAVRAALLGES